MRGYSRYDVVDRIYILVTNGRAHKASSEELSPSVSSVPRDREYATIPASFISREVNHRIPPHVLRISGPQSNSAAQGPLFLSRARCDATRRADLEIVKLNLFIFQYPPRPPFFHPPHSRAFLHIYRARLSLPCDITLN